MLAAIITAIKTSDLASLKHGLDHYPLLSLEFIDVDVMFATLLQHAERIELEPSGLSLIFDRFAQVYDITVAPASAFTDVGAGTDDDTTNDLARYFVSVCAGLYSIPLTTLTYLVLSFEFNITELLTHIITAYEAHRGPIFSVCADRLLNAIPDDLRALTPLPTWGTLHSLAQEKKRFDVIAYVEQRMRQYAQFAPVPKWVSVGKEELKFPDTVMNPKTWNVVDEKASSGGAPTGVVTSSEVHDFKDTVNDMVQLCDKDGEEIDDELYNQLLTIAIGSTPSSAVTGPGGANPDRLFGPLNAMVDRECPTSIAGGCRMLTCCCRENDDDEEFLDPDAPTAWFEGACDHCFKRIRNPSHVVRLAIVGGGWLGCFCSDTCVMESGVREKTADSQLLNEHVFATIANIGIYNRDAQSAKRT